MMLAATLSISSIPGSVRFEINTAIAGGIRVIMQLPFIATHRLSLAIWFVFHGSAGR
jgi:hypothetical protein